MLIRTVFYYGNYDRKSSSPSFNVLFDGKHIGTISVISAFDPYVLELIFSPASRETSVCFLRTSSSNPFVSSIEVVELDSGMYDELGPGEGMFYQARIAYGATRDLRYIYKRLRILTYFTISFKYIDSWYTLSFKHILQLLR